MSKWAVGLILALAVSTIAIASSDRDSAEELTASTVVGFWETPHEGDGWSRIEIYECEDRICGRIAWVHEPHYPEDDPEGMPGQLKVDRKNPDESRRNDPIVGLELMHSFEFDEKKREWKNGRIYDPKSGKEYRCKMKIEDDLLKVRGFVKILFAKVGRTSDWTRVESPSPDTDPPVESTH